MSFHAQIGFCYGRAFFPGLQGWQAHP